MRIIALILLILAAPGAAFAQDRAAQAAQRQPSGPMVIERLHAGFLVAPDFKITTVNRTTSELAGGYAGWVTDSSIFIGGGGYWLTNRSRDRKMGYGGVVIGFLARTDRRIGFGGKGLLGVGTATIGEPTFFDLRDRQDYDFGFGPRFGRSQGFFVADPEADLYLKLTNRLRLGGEFGYRVIGADRGLDNRLRGLTGGVTLQVGGGS
jgi:hypothetical protein